MSYDIYGNNLRPGHCEVHPSVHEEYPCSVCMMENDLRRKQKQEYEADMAKERDAYYEEQRKQYDYEMAYKEIGLPIS